MKTVYVSGVFDMFHYGHIRLLKKCEEIAFDLKKSTEGNIRLLIGVHNDKDCTNYKRQPILTMNERSSSIIEIFEMLGQRGIFVAILVDAPLVETQELYLEQDIIKVLHAHSEDEDDYYSRFYKTAKNMGIFQRMEYTGGISTSEIIERVNDRTYNLL